MDATRRLVGQGCGKLILFGEHSVVYGVPAIVAGLPRGATAWVRMSDKTTLTIVNGRTGKVHVEVEADPNGEPLARAYAAILAALEVEGPVAVQATIEVPIGSGLGSSAAMAAATARALAQFFGLNLASSAVDLAVSQAERVFHGNPSGIDQAAALGGGLFRFTRGTPATIEALWMESVSVVICEAGPAASTLVMVEKVARFHERQPTLARGLDALVAKIVDDAAGALSRADWVQVGELMNINHGLLVSMGVSTPGLDRACHLARGAGALGAKLTGSGGGGCMVALAPENPQNVIQALNDAGFDAFEVTIP